MKKRKIKKKIEGTILEKRIKDLNFFILEYSSKKDIFIKRYKYNNYFNKYVFKHPIVLTTFQNLNDLIHYTKIKKICVIFNFINKIIIQNNINNINFLTNEYLFMHVEVALKRVHLFLIL